MKHTRRSFAGAAAMATSWQVRVGKCMGTGQTNATATQARSAPTYSTYWLRMGRKRRDRDISYVLISRDEDPGFRDGAVQCARGDIMSLIRYAVLAAVLGCSLTTIGASGGGDKTAGLDRDMVRAFV